jgi:hypothetical protein
MLKAWGTSKRWDLVRGDWVSKGLVGSGCSSCIDYAKSLGSIFNTRNKKEKERKEKRMD